MGKVKLIISFSWKFFYWVLDIIFIVMKEKRLKPSSVHHRACNEWTDYKTL